MLILIFLLLFIRYISQEQFDVIEKLARNKEIKKRSKIIKEVNEENNEEIFQKILKKRRLKQIEDEESKIHNTKIKFKVKLLNLS